MSEGGGGGVWVLRSGRWVILGGQGRRGKPESKPNSPQTSTLTKSPKPAIYNHVSPRLGMNGILRLFLRFKVDFPSSPFLCQSKNTTLIGSFAQFANLQLAERACIGKKDKEKKEGEKKPEFSISWQQITQAPLVVDLQP